ncbi:MAG TPA: hypothetical protein ENJ33_09020 [Thiothrix sp.]|nr:hypothetical protein [Thiothrix sp.]
MNITKSGPRSVLFQVLILLLVIAVLLLMQKQTLYDLYIGGDDSRMGLMLNGIVVVVFLLGLTRIVIVLLSYAREQEMLLRLAKNVKKKSQYPLAGLAEKSLAAKRYQQIRWIYDHNAPINQAALASSLNASESSRFTLIRFVHNILILIGVFGTVVSLSVALVGASGLLDSPAESMQRMGLIISSMSTALSTTITAIVCFIIYAYFFLRLNDVKIHLLSSIEDVTSLYILPRMTHNEETMVRDVAKLTTALRQAAERMGEVETRFIAAGEGLQATVGLMQQQVSRIDTDMGQMKELLREGFRLPHEMTRNNVAVSTEKEPNHYE